MKNARHSKLRGRVVLVSGASQGIGLSVAQALALAGARVVLAARRGGLVEAEAARLRSQGGDVLAVAMDVTSDSSVGDAVARTLAHYGRIDIVLNNAGNGGELGLWADTDASALRDVFDVHLFGAERVARAVLPCMRAQGGGAIVQVASTVGWVPMPGGAAYSAAKAAVIALSAALRAELAAEGIDVRVFAPPHTRTQAGDAWPLDLPKVFEPSWVAQKLVAFLAGRAPLAVVGGNWLLLVLQRISPRWAAKIMEGIGFRALARCDRRLGGGRSNRLAL